MKHSRGNGLAKSIDRIVGIPGLALAGLFSRQKVTPNTLESIAVISLGCIGDTLLLDGPLRDLRKAHPECKVTFFASHSNSATAAMLETVDKVVTLPLSRPWTAFGLLRAKTFDACVDAGQWARISALFARAIRADIRIGFSTPGQHRHCAFDVSVPHLDTRHEIDNYRKLFKPLGIEGNAVPTVASSTGTALPEPYVIFHMIPSGTKSHMKEWPEDRWQALATHFSGLGMNVLYSGSPADIPRIEKHVQQIGNPLIKSLAGKTSQAELASVLGKAALVVSVNTGIMHLAAAVGAPLVALNGPTSVKRWGPVARKDKAISLASTRDCAPCLHLGFEYGCDNNQCMDDIHISQVIEAAEKLL